MLDGFATTTSSSSTWLCWHWWLQLWCYVVCILEDDLDLDVDFKVVAVALRDLLPDQAAQGDREVQEGMNVQKKKIPQRHFTGRWEL